MEREKREKNTLIMEIHDVEEKQLEGIANVRQLDAIATGRLGHDMI